MGARRRYRLLGDFVIIVSDEQRRRVVCLRAPLGQHPLFYSRGRPGLVFGSEIQQVVRHPAIQTGVDEGMVAEYLSAEPATVSDTLWRDVHRLPPAHVLEIADGNIRVRRYWDFDPDARLDYSRSDKYAEHLHEIFEHAVGCCVTDFDRAGVFLSGGLDSSAVAGVARLTVLRLCSGDHTLADIERAVFDAHRDLFASPSAAATFVAEVVTRYGR